jgi:glycosyltransferase involved in cell wall biosynthesis
MAQRKFKILAVAAHPVQYMAPLFRRLAQRSECELQVAYCSLKGAESASFDPDFAASFQWDVPLLDGYPWVEIPNKGSGEESFFGLRNPGLKALIREGRFDAVLCYLSYLRASFWMARSAAAVSGAAFLFGTDAHSLAPRDAKAWKIWVKNLLWPRLFRLADQVFVPSTKTFEMVQQLGIPEERITLTPYSVDNEWWKAQSAQIDRVRARQELGADDSQPVILFCAKLQPWKRPLDLLRAFARAEVHDSLLVFAGDGPQRAELETEARTLGVESRVRFPGFVNQSKLPALYTAADLMVLPSSYEPFAVVVNEAMCCGCPAVVSDQVGAARDLVAPVRPEFVYASGDVAALAKILRSAFGDRESLRETARKGYQHVEAHSQEKTIAGTIEAVRAAVERRRKRQAGQ